MKSNSLHLKPMSEPERFRPRRHKYNARRTTLKGVSFDSKAEAARYADLLLLVRAKQIRDLEVQKRFLVFPAFRHAGKHIRGIFYVADFFYQDARGNWIAEDVKGVETPVFKIKRKLFMHEFPQIELRVLKGGRG